MECFVDKFDFDVLFGAEILLYFLLGLVPHIILNAEVKTEFLIFFVDVMGQTVNFDIFHLLQILNLLEKLFNSDVLSILVLKQLAFERIELVLGEEADIIDFFLVQH